MYLLLVRIGTLYSGQTKFENQRLFLILRCTLVTLYTTKDFFWAFSKQLQNISSEHSANSCKRFLLGIQKTAAKDFFWAFSKQLQNISSGHSANSCKRFLLGIRKQLQKISSGHSANSCKRFLLGIQQTAAKHFFWAFSKQLQ